MRIAQVLNIPVCNEPIDAIVCAEHDIGDRLAVLSAIRQRIRLAVDMHKALVASSCLKCIAGGIN